MTGARPWTLGSVLCFVCLAVACAPPVNLKKVLLVEAVTTGWMDVGSVAGKNKLVPVVSFRLKNVSARKLAVLQVNALFHRAADEDEWGSGFISDAASGALAPGGATGALTIKSQLGYTGTESRAEMLENSRFVDANVDLFAKSGSTPWTKLGRYRVSRQLLAR
jgi:hypothetical protein